MVDRGREAPPPQEAAGEAPIPHDDGLARVRHAGPTGAEPRRWGSGPGPHEVTRFLEGPQPRRSELRRALRIFAEFIRGFRALHFVGPCVTVFGSARFPEDHAVLRARARDRDAELARAGFTVMTGGGPGIMEAANRGAREAGGRSIGCNIELPARAAAEPVPRPLDHLPPLLRAAR